MRRPASVLCIAAFLALACDAGATIPQGNLLANPGAESGTFVGDEVNHACPQSWPNCQGNMTAVAYGTTTFPGVAESSRIGGGHNFIAGGPDSAFALVSQSIQLGAQPEFAAGTVKTTFGGCLGGFADQDDYVSLELTLKAAPDPSGFTNKYTFPLRGPGAAERGNQTKLLPVSETVNVPAGVQSFIFDLHTFRVSPGSYDDGYADNLSVTFGPATGPDPPASTCSAPSGGGGGGGIGGGAGGGKGGKGGANSPKGVLSFGKAVVDADGNARIKLTCNTTQVSKCNGTVSTSLVRATSSRKKRKRGTARYSIGSLKSRTIKVPLRRSDLRKIRGFSKSKLAKRRLRLRTTTKVGTAKLLQTTLVAVRVR